MLKDALVALGWVSSSNPSSGQAARHNRWVASLPCAGASIQELGPLHFAAGAAGCIGFVAGILTMLLGIGGGFILVPAMIYLLGMAPRVVIGTSLMMILAVSAGDDHGPFHDHAGGRHRACRAAADRRRRGRPIWRAAGHAAQARPASPGAGRIILLVALRMFLGLAWRPDEIFTVELSVKSLARAALLALLAADAACQRDQAGAGPRRLRARSRSATASPARSCCCSGQSSIPAGAGPTDAPISRSSLKGPVEPIWCARSRRSPASG
jgi:hypothetical protein